MNKNKCYAYRDEKRYPNVLKYRIKQQKAFNGLKPKDIAIELLKTILKYNVKDIRFNESGDISNQRELDKIIAIAEYLYFIPIYGFSANKELDFSYLPNNLIINGSGFMVDNSFNVIAKNDKSNYKHICKSDCTICNLCKSKKGLDIKVREH